MGRETVQDTFCCLDAPYVLGSAAHFAVNYKVKAPRLIGELRNVWADREMELAGMRLVALQLLAETRSAISTNDCWLLRRQHRHISRASSQQLRDNLARRWVQGNLYPPPPPRKRWIISCALHRTYESWCRAAKWVRRIRLRVGPSIASKSTALALTCPRCWLCSRVVLGGAWWFCEKWGTTATWAISTVSQRRCTCARSADACERGEGHGRCGLQALRRQRRQGPPHQEGHDGNVSGRNSEHKRATSTLVSCRCTPQV